jgi:hypothetical protein
VGRATEKALIELIYKPVPQAVMCTNGTAVEGVCVTGAASRVLVLFVGSEAVPVASQYGAIFAITTCEGLVTIAVQVVCLLMTRMFKCFVSYQGNFANIVLSKLPQLTVLWAALYLWIKVGQLSRFISIDVSLHSTFPKSNLLLSRALPIFIDVK